jgi:glyoxylase-like metal-dependent hydrolase (beta-lactamase superfamily II)
VLDPVFLLASSLIAVHIFIMREILPGIFTWGSTYADRPWDLNGYAIALTGGTVLIDPPAPEEADWQKLPKPITTVVLTNRDHVRDAALFKTRYGAHIVAGKDEVSQFAPLTIDAVVQEGDLIGSALRVIHLPGKSRGEIALYIEPAYHTASRERGGILVLGDAIIGNLARPCKTGPESHPAKAHPNRRGLESYSPVPGLRLFPAMQKPTRVFHLPPAILTQHQEH